MVLEHLCDMDLGYREQFQLVKPYGGEEGSGYGEGDGTVTGPRLSGTVRWINHPRRRSDGRMLPDAGGMIETGDGARVMFRMQGRTVFTTDASGARKGGQLLWILFESEAPELSWLNDALCVIEGVIDGETGRIRFRVHSCINELIGQVRESE